MCDNRKVMSEKDAEAKALEYAGGIMIKRAMLANNPECTITATTNFNDLSRCTVHYDLVMAWPDGRRKIIEGKTRSRNYRLDNRYIQDMSVNLTKFQWVQDASRELDCEASVVGVYPWDDAVMEWDANGTYEDSTLTSRDSYVDKNSKVTEKPVKKLRFSQAARLHSDGSDFEGNFRKAYKKYSGKEYDGTDY